MGYKASLIIIENPNGFSDEQTLLSAIGFGNYIFKEETCLELCIYPNDQSINIGFYNGNIIIADDYQITSKFIETENNLNLIKEENNLIKLFPNSEILSVACHSGNNLHAYSLIQNGEKTRAKTVSADFGMQEVGKRFSEEEEIYKDSYLENGENFWKDGEDIYSEDCLMEDFTFGIAKRLLKVRIDNYNESKELGEVIFRKYMPKKTELIKKTIIQNKYFQAFVLLVVYFLFRFIAKNFF